MMGAVAAGRDIGYPDQDTERGLIPSEEPREEGRQEHICSHHPDCRLPKNLTRVSIKL